MPLAGFILEVSLHAQSSYVPYSFTTVAGQSGNVGSMVGGGASLGAVPVEWSANR